ncbi:hypothetical protein G7K_2952-t1 [Saitoella complicata NRRL Y-17804]|uniref:Vacuolar protein sorting-associated protein 41 n=2 Tax=Saitoella complicata (strain BCRC 22490 / CBS 7301 / JCM 7358 / NBRC 10748 / NRRL Y-17804) TaxID=698492 RepID=A0A0E9NG41_SAICN|nr:hypothetical protein G7K_2952-t1 [Saitoella complicata NRRL Y-17804]
MEHSDAVDERIQSQEEDPDSSSSMGSDESRPHSQDGSEGGSSDDDDEEEEPRLKYVRCAGDIPSIITSDPISAFVISDKYMVLGSHNGKIYILDVHTSKELRRLRAHAASIMDLSLDFTSSYLASASLDGKVAVIALAPDTPASNNYHLDFKRPVRTVSIDPEYGSGKRRVVSGGMAGQLVLSERGWLGNKDTILHSGEGDVYEVRWRGNYIAWSNEAGVKIYHTSTQQRISHLPRPANSPRADLFRSRLTWRDDSTLLVGWADTVTVAKVIEPTPGSSDKKVPHVQITSIFRTDSIVAGVVQFGTELLILACEADKRDPEEIASSGGRKPGERPELRLINAKHEEVSSDELGMRGYERLQPNDYILTRHPGKEEVYVVGPSDLVRAWARDGDDHIEWLLSLEKYEQALDAVRALDETGGSEKFTVKDVGGRYLEHLIRDGKWSRAALIASEVLGDDREGWEKWIFRFAEAGELNCITPYIPTGATPSQGEGEGEVQLSPLVYEMVLAYYLSKDEEMLYETVKTWPSELYDVGNVVSAVEEKRRQDKANETLMNCLAELHTYNRNPKAALNYYLRLRRPTTFDLIREFHLFDAVQDDILLLMDLDRGEAGEEGDGSIEGVRSTKRRALNLLVEHSHSIPVAKVVPQLEDEPILLHVYLDAVWRNDPHLTVKYGDLQVDLYAEYERTRLEEFLRISNSYSLQNAAEICERRGYITELVFILGRMGDNKRALMLIIEKLRDVERAIEFAKAQDDKELWDDLLNYSMDKPEFIRGLLENAGTTLNPIVLVKRIPEGLEIPGLKASLMKVLHDHELQVSLAVGCSKILTADVSSQFKTLRYGQKRGISFEVNTDCGICTKPTYTQERHGLVTFACRHIFHEECFLEKTEDEQEREEAVDRTVIYGGRIKDKVIHAALIEPQLRKGCPMCH